MFVRRLLTALGICRGCSDSQAQVSGNNACVSVAVHLPGLPGLLGVRCLPWGPADALPEVLFTAVGHRVIRSSATPTSEPGKRLSPQTTR